MWTPRSGSRKGIQLQLELYTRMASKSDKLSNLDFIGTISAALQIMPHNNSNNFLNYLDDFNILFFIKF